MLLNEQCCSLLFQQCYCCSAFMKQQRLFTVVETGENNIDRTSLFIVAQPCSQVVTVLMVEQCCNNIVIMTEQQLVTSLFTGCSTTLFTVGSTTLFTPVDNLQQVVRLYACNSWPMPADRRHFMSCFWLFGWKRVFLCLLDVFSV